MSTPTADEICSNCGAATADGSRTCSNCGQSTMILPAAPTTADLSMGDRHILERGLQIGRFKLLEVLGKGGFATVYEAEDTQLRRRVALKLLHLHLGADPDFARRFLAEARAAARLRHPHVVTIHDVGETPNKQLYLVMELLSGTLLSDLVEQSSRISFDQTTSILTQLASALDYIHTQGLVHRDLKPSNVMVDERGHVTLMDFGIARSLDDDSHLTQPGQVVGTVAYMSPEQISGETLSPASDVYSLGILAYELLAGRPPFTGSMSGVMIKQLQEPPPPLVEFRPGLPTSVYPAVEVALSKAPASRPSSAAAFIAALTDAEPPGLAAGSARPSRPFDRGASAPVRASNPRQRLFTIAGLALVVIALCVGILILRSRPSLGGPTSTVQRQTSTTRPVRVTVATLAGAGTAGFVDGVGAAAQFSGPGAITLDPGGNLYVTDVANRRVRKIAPNGVVTTLAGSGVQGSLDGPGPNARFDTPAGIVVDLSGNVYVTDLGSHRIRRIGRDGIVSTVAGSGIQGFADGPALSAQFANPAGITVGPGGNLYVADLGNNRIRKVTPDGTVSTLAGSGATGFADGQGQDAQFSTPLDILVDTTGSLFVSDVGNHRIRKITPTGAVTTVFGPEIPAASGQMPGAGGIAVDAAGNLYLTDTSDPHIRKITPDGRLLSVLELDKPDVSPFGIVADRAGNLFITDGTHNAIYKLRVPNAK